MQFYKWERTIDEKWYRAMLRAYHGDKDALLSALVEYGQTENRRISRLELMRSCFEIIYSKCRQPFFRVWPQLLTPLLRLDLNGVRGSQLVPPERALSVEFPVCSPLALDHAIIESALIGNIGLDDQRRANLFWCYWSHNAIERTYRDGVVKVHADHSLDFENDKSWALPYGEAHLEKYAASKYSTPLTLDGIKIIGKVLAFICLLANDPDPFLLSPIVLSNDAGKYAETGDLKYVYRAARRGLLGWDIGKHIPTPEQIQKHKRELAESRDREIAPHYRNPHLALRWTGKNSAVPKVVFVRGSFVNKDKAVSVPTGYYGEGD